MFKLALGWFHRTPSKNLKTPRKEAAGSAPVPGENLSREGTLFLRAVQGKVTLLHTAKRFPHVINKLALSQHEPAKIIAAIDELLMVGGERNRGGFPFEVVLELTDLKAFCGRLWRGE
jgi:hypothetical protein